MSLKKVTGLAHQIKNRKQSSNGAAVQRLATLVRYLYSARSCYKDFFFFLLNLRLRRDSMCNLELVYRPHTYRE